MGVAALVLVVSATIASVYIIAIFMIIAGGGEIAFAFGARSWARFFLWVIAGLAYIVVGAFALAQPLMAAALFTLLLGVAMFVDRGSSVSMSARISTKMCAASSILAGVVTSLGRPRRPDRLAGQQSGYPRCASRA